MRASKHFAVALVSDAAGANMLLDVAAELEKEALVAESRHAASALLELYLSHHSGAGSVWHRLGQLRRRDGRLAEARHCFQLAGE